MTRNFSKRQKQQIKHALDQTTHPPPVVLSDEQRQALEHAKRKNGQQIACIDRHVIATLQQRQRAVLQVGAIKQLLGEPIVNRDREEQRLKDIAAHAERAGLHPEFARSVLYAIIGESCKVQHEQSYRVMPEPDEPIGSEARYQHLQRNLLQLTELVADQYDAFYRGNYYGLAAYLAFEREIIRHHASRVDQAGIAVDLGTADGGVARFCCELGFGRVAGFDISPAMVAHAKQQSAEMCRLRFEEADIEAEIPIEDGAATMVIMNEGTAGDVRDIRRVIGETQRVLRRGGIAIFSFYNRDALLYQYPCYPYETSLAAGLNRERECLDVCAPNGGIFPIHAKPHTVKEVRELFGDGLELVQMVTHPTFTAIQPNDLFETNKGIPQSFLAIDQEIATLPYGAYIIAVAKQRA